MIEKNSRCNKETLLLQYKYLNKVIDMKQMRLMMMAFAMILTAGATAQMRPQRITQEQMTKKMVSEQKLDEKQTKKVTKLNKKFKKLIEGEQQDNMKGQRPPMGQGRPGGNQGGGAPGGGMGGPGGGGNGVD
ncbi:hypothetical protein PRU_0282 [Xylanibacter ruminicola 23]|uniref:DUF4890 domain-containing protein n=3 Tax=Xylanibacter ruminicola TaxID=839 RepID=D5EWB8_XYLR2|nr:hypothetical protein PRU_0282 [Xylanibacter ruminicola 23]